MQMLVQLQEMYIVTVQNFISSPLTSLLYANVSATSNSRDVVTMQEYVLGKPENSVNIIILINWGGPFLLSYTCQILL